MLKKESELKAAGMESCARHYRDQLLRVKRLAYECAIQKGTITASDVREAAEIRGVVIPSHGGFMGGIFRGKEWEKVSPSTARTKGSHGHGLWFWKLRNQPQPLTSVPVQKQEPEKKTFFNTELFEIPRLTSYEFLP